MQWRDLEHSVYEEALESERGDLLYLKDQYTSKHPTDQSELSDFADPRYELRLRPWYQPIEHDGELLARFESGELEEAELSIDFVLSNEQLYL